jgi:hypothetical protein
LTSIYASSVEGIEADPKTSPLGYSLRITVPLWLTFQALEIVSIAFSARGPIGWQLAFVGSRSSRCW